MRINLICLIILFYSTLISAQQTSTTGNLLRIDLTKTPINSNDTLWQWMDINTPNGSIYQSCDETIYINNTKFLSIQKSNTDPWNSKNYTYLYNCSTKSTREMIEDYPLFDPQTLFYYTPVTQSANNGMWFFYGLRRSPVFVRGDTIYTTVSLNNLSPIHLCGKIMDKYLVVVLESNTNDWSLYTADLNNPPGILLRNKIVVQDSTGVTIPSIATEIYPLRDSMFVYKFENYLFLAVFSGDKIKIIKTITPQNPNPTQYNFRQWHIADENLIYVEGNKLFIEKFDYNSNSFQGKSLLRNLTSSYYTYSYSSDNHYFAYIINDSLVVFSAIDQKEIYRNSIKSIKYIYPLLIEWPYAYIHQIKNITGIENGNKIPSEFCLSQNYPNPFNPTTAISFQLPAYSHVSLKVFDVLGREVATLVNEYKPAGNYRIQFNASKLVSGVYFYRMESGTFSQTKKLVVLK